MTENGINYINISEKELSAIIKITSSFVIRCHNFLENNNNVELTAKKILKKLQAKKTLPSVFFLINSFNMKQDTPYAPKDMSKLYSDNLKCSFLNPNYEKYFSDANNNAIHSRDLSEILDSVQSNFRTFQIIRGKKCLKKLIFDLSKKKRARINTSRNGYHSSCKVLDELIELKKLFDKPEITSIVKEFIQNNNIIKKYVKFMILIFLYILRISNNNDLLIKFLLSSNPGIKKDFRVFGLFKNQISAINIEHINKLAEIMTNFLLENHYYITYKLMRISLLLK